MSMRLATSAILESATPNFLLRKPNEKIIPETTTQGKEIDQVPCIATLPLTVLTRMKKEKGCAVCYLLMTKK
jgi:hypothetical protein